MDTMLAFAMGQANRHRELMVFDWEKAAQIIVERGAKNVSAGLSGAWDYTGGPILKDGRPGPEEETCVYLASTWATPELEIDGETIDCYRVASATPGWDAHTYWPQTAFVRDVFPMPRSVLRPAQAS
jgi:hypothetical protein